MEPEERRQQPQPPAPEEPARRADKRELVAEGQLSNSSLRGGGSGSGTLALGQQQQQQSRPQPPPLPPKPAIREALQVASSSCSGGREPSRAAGGQALVASHSLGAHSLLGPASPVASARRHALQEQSLERDAALSLNARERHKRTSSIKSALRHAHLGPLRSSSSKRASEKVSHSASSAAAPDGQVKSMPYELFEPPITQRTFQRSKRRGAMLADPKRQMSVDTIGLRQLTDEYLQNAGVKPISSSGQCSLVALTAPTSLGQLTLQGSSEGGASCSPGGQQQQQQQQQRNTLATYIPNSLLQQQCSIEAQLYQAGKQAIGCTRTGLNAANISYSSEDSLSNVTILPGNLPWQSDVSIQCELLRVPPIVEPYETTGDILNTIAGPFRSSTQALSSESSAFDGSAGGGGGGGGNQLSATLKRGLSAISQHHLSPAQAPSAALNVVGNLKKSLSNTLDISLASARGQHLPSQDSLPAYSSLLNEPESPDGSCATGNRPSGAGQLGANSSSLDPETGGLISKLTRQSSKKFSAGKRGLQRALSFDCRGYKRLDGEQSNDSGGSATSRNLLLSAKQRAHNKSTLGLNVDCSPRPYLPQSASQVDFQVPLLPFHRMQDAIVSQRLLEPPPAAAAATAAPPSQSGASMGQQATQEAAGSKSATERQLDADELLCGDNPAGALELERTSAQVSEGAN